MQWALTPSISYTGTTSLLYCFLINKEIELIEPLTDLRILVVLNLYKLIYNSTWYLLCYRVAFKYICKLRNSYCSFIGTRKVCIAKEKCTGRPCCRTRGGTFWNFLLVLTFLIFWCLLDISCDYWHYWHFLSLMR